mmetsp:Transcript_19298/g.28551  ORF Transcript_19298/g.28551 Transcript_19298/m.28551 type:complete len:1098 (+) Transcript_19298:85-3378(+)
MNITKRFSISCLFSLLFANVQSFHTLPKPGCQFSRHRCYEGAHQASINHEVEKSSEGKAMKGQKKSTRASQQKRTNGKATKKRRGKMNFYGKNSSDTRFRQLNQKIVSSNTAKDIVLLLASNPNALTKTSGGGVLNTVNFATSIHRIARDVGNKSQERAAVLSDPKFALFLCSYAEALLGIDSSMPLSALKEFSLSQVDDSCKFSIRERTNLIWALAKLRVVPPLDALPMGDRAETKKLLLETSVKLRTDILASQKANDKAWISTLSSLAAYLMDFVGTTMLDLSEDDEVNMQEVVNMLWAFATAQRSDLAVFDELGSLLAFMFEKSPKPPKPQELSISFWAFATAKYVTNSQQRLLLCLTQFLDDQKWRMSFKTQELANTAWGISNLINHRRQSGEANNGSLEQQQEDLLILKIVRYLARAMIDRCDEYTTQEISNTIWAFGNLGFGIGAAAAKKGNINDYIILKSNDYDGDEILGHEVLSAVRKSALKRLPRFKEQELNNLAYGCARMNKPQPEIFSGIADEFSRRKSKITGQDIGATLWSFATTEFFDPVAFSKVLSRLQMDAVQFWNPQEISNIVWSIGTAGIQPRYSKAFDSTLVLQKDRHSFEEISRDPISLAFAAAAKEVLRRPDEFKSQEIKDSLWGFSKAGVRHPMLFKHVAEYLVGSAMNEVPPSKLHIGVGLEDFSSQEIANLCWAYAKQGSLASDNSEAVKGRMGIYCSSATDFGETLLKRLMNCAVEADLANYDDLSRLSTNDMSNTVWALATLGFRFDNFLELVAKQVLTRCKSCLSSHDTSSGTVFNGRELTNIMWSFATLDAITPELLDAIEPLIVSACGDGSARSIASFLKRQELANLVWCCAVAGHYPPKMVRILQRGLIGETTDEKNPEYMDEIHGQDGGLTDQGIVTLIYLHYSLELDGVSAEIELPKDFPSGWGIFQDCDLLEDETGISLTVTTSKTQENVASAFSRIDLDFVDEYIVPFPGKLPEILSLDIADPVQKFGIEVDGPSHFYYSMDQWSPEDPPRQGRVRVGNSGLIEYTFDWDKDHNKPNGSTSLKSRLLRKLGWKIVRIPFWDWQDLNGDEKAQEDYCRQALKRAG